MRKKAITVILLCLTICVGFILMYMPAYGMSTAQATEPISADTPCELNICYAYNDKVFDGESVKIWQAASVSEDYQYTLTEAFSSLGLPINGITSQKEWAEVTTTLVNFAETRLQDAAINSRTDTKGTAHFEKLEPGLYIVSAVKADRDESLYTFDPFIVHLPALSEDGTWKYMADAKPKGDEYKPENKNIEYKAVKLWQDAGYKSKRPSSVEIDIYKDDELVKTAALSNANNWTYRWSAKDDKSNWYVIEKKVPDEYTMRIQKNGKTFTITNVTSEGPPPPNTGDSSNILLWAILGFISGGCLIALGIICKNRSKV